MKYICKIASIDEMNTKWDYEINCSIDKINWIIWKKENILNMQKGYIIPYYGILNGEIICESTVAINPSVVQNSEGLVGKEICYLYAIRTIPKYQGMGYFSKLFTFIINDLKSKGYRKVTIGVEPKEIKNKAIYMKYGFDKFIKQGIEKYPLGEEIVVDYYEKRI